MARVYADHRFDGNALSAVDAVAKAQVERTLEWRAEYNGLTGG